MKIHEKWPTREAVGTMLHASSTEPTPKNSDRRCFVDMIRGQGVPTFAFIQTHYDKDPLTVCDRNRAIRKRKTRRRKHKPENQFGGGRMKEDYEMMSAASKITPPLVNCGQRAAPRQW